MNEVMRAIDKELFFTFPHDNEALLKLIATGFTRNGRSHLKGCVGTVDGVAVKKKCHVWKIMVSVL